MKALTFIVTDKCNIECDFCAPGCGPHHRGHLSDALMVRTFDRLMEVGHVPVVVFTGGEPLLFRRDVTAAIRHISAHADTPTRIVTNASWAVSPEAARRVLLGLKQAGLAELNYSVDDFHQAWIPEERIRYAVNAALELGIPVLLAHKMYPGSRSSRESYERLLDRPVPVFDEASPENCVWAPLAISTGYTLPIGRGAESVDVDAWVPADLPEQAWKGPCNEVLRSLQVSPGGQLSPCCGLVDRLLGVFYAGSVVEDDILCVLERANRSVLYNWLALSGPSGMMDYIRSVDGAVRFAGKYVQNCQICQEIFSDEKKCAIVAEALPAMGHALGVSRCFLEASRAVVAGNSLSGPDQQAPT